MYGRAGGSPTFLNRIPIIVSMTILVPLRSLTFRDLSWQNPYNDLKDVAIEEI